VIHGPRPRELWTALLVGMHPALGIHTGRTWHPCTPPLVVIHLGHVIDALGGSVFMTRGTASTRTGLRSSRLGPWVFTSSLLASTKGAPHATEVRPPQDPGPGWGTQGAGPGSYEVRGWVDRSAPTPVINTGYPKTEGSGREIPRGPTPRPKSAHHQYQPCPPLVPRPGTPGPKRRDPISMVRPR
jgi:hypothetical protein